MPQTQHFFIDESGNPTFYANRKRPLWEEPDFDPVLMLGMIVVQDRKALRKQILDFREQLLVNPLLNSIHSVTQPDWFFHASKDHSDIRLKFFEFLYNLEGVQCYIVIGRKNPAIFHSKHNGNASEFYFDVLNKLLARFDFTDDGIYKLYLSQRQSNTMERFETALHKALHHPDRHFDKSKFMCRIVPSKDYPELSVIDYYLWAIKRYIVSGDGRFFKAFIEKYTEIVDLYEDEGKGRIYDSKNTFSIEKATPFMKK